MYDINLNETISDGQKAQVNALKAEILDLVKGRHLPYIFVAILEAQRQMIRTYEIKDERECALLIDFVNSSCFQLKTLIRSEAKRRAKE